MYTFQLLTTLSLLSFLTLPLAILSAPAAAPAIVPRGTAEYWLTTAKIFRTEDKDQNRIQKLFIVTVKGVNEGALDITCSGALLITPTISKPSAVLECPQDPNVGVVVSSDLTPVFDITVQLA
ncbi:MAG: hypothetical protein Q9172_007540 [Xanthocarpia lactea]